MKDSSRRDRKTMTTVFTFITRAARKAVLGPAETLLLLRMAGWVTLLSLAVKALPLPKALSLLSTRTRPGVQTPKAATKKRLADAIDLLLKADLFILKPTCWKRAAVLHRYLALNGITTSIQFGMRREADGSISGHAWLEEDGSPILEVTPPNYAVTYSFPSSENFEIDLHSLAPR